MARRRFTRWFDSFFDQTLSSAVAGEILTLPIISEAVLEDEVSARSTIVRIIGQLRLVQAMGAPEVDLSIWGGVATGFAATGFLIANNYEDPRLMWTYRWNDDVNSSTVSQSLIEVDVRAKRKMLPHTRLDLVANTVNVIVDQDARLSGHLRTLILLP